MKVKRILAMFIVMAFSAAVSFVYADEKVDLKLRLEKGQSYKMRTLNEMKIKQTMPGQPQPMTITQKNETKNIYTVEDVQADGTFVLKVTYDELSFKTENPMVEGGTTEYNSSDTSTAVGPIASVLGAIVGQSFTITITPDGHVKEVQGIDAFCRRMEEKINELPEEQMRVGMEAQFKAQYSEEALKANMENSFNMYPDNPIGIGDTWQRKTTMNQGFPMVIDSIYTLKERKNGIAVFDVFAMIQTNRDVGPTEMGAMKIRYNMSGSVTGIMEIQESTGWVIRSNQNLRLTGSVIVQSPEMQQPMSIPMSITGPITVELYL